MDDGALRVQDGEEALGDVDRQGLAVDAGLAGGLHGELRVPSPAANERGLGGGRGGAGGFEVEDGARYPVGVTLGELHAAALRPHPATHRPLDQAAGPPVRGDGAEGVDGGEGEDLAAALVAGAGRHDGQAHGEDEGGCGVEGQGGEGALEAGVATGKN